VDDDQTTRTTTKSLVEALGHQSETARDGIEALAKLRMGVDLVLLDVVMPGPTATRSAAAFERILPGWTSP
jgi:putative two-component system response regulator